MAKAKFSKIEMQNDLKICLYKYFSELWRIYGKGSNCLALIDKKTGQVGFKFDGEIDSDKAEAYSDFDIENMEITCYMDMLYDYAFEGKLRKSLDVSWINVDEDIAPFIYDLSRMLIISNNIEYFPIGNLLTVIDTADARRGLDWCGAIPSDNLTEVPSDYLEFKTVVTLSGLDEKTVRNMANPKAANRLKTENIKGKTYVKLQDAKEWLIARGYKETYDFNDVLERDIGKAGFFNFQNFADYVSATMQAKNISQEGMTQILGGTKEVAAWLDIILQGQKLLHDECAEYSEGFEFDQALLMKLSHTLDLNVREFLLAVYEMVQNHKLKVFKKSLSAFN